jgi:hypothetical protein
MAQQVSTIYDIMKSQGRFTGNKVKGAVGVEIETETKKKYDYPLMKYWNTVKDNSLRDFGVEYVLKAPMDMPEFEKALAEFDQAEKKYKFEKGSISTSVHVHVNMLDDTYLTLANFATAYTLVENPLIRYSGPDRLSNLFCLPICDAEGVKDNLVHLFQNVNRNMWNRVSVDANRCKYGALNPAPISTLGTFEIRSFRGETDVKVIQSWVDIVLKLKEFARRPGLTPPDILLMWKNNKSAILEIIFQEYASELRFKDPKTGKDATEDLIYQNLKYAADIAAVSKDWTKFGILKLKPVYLEKCKDALDALSQKRFQVPFDSLPYHERLVVLELYHRNNPNQKVVSINEDL